MGRERRGGSSSRQLPLHPGLLLGQPYVSDKSELSRGRKARNRVLSMELKEKCLYQCLLSVLIVEDPEDL